MSSIWMKTSQWANESAEQTPATDSFIHSKVYWHTQCYVPTNLSLLEQQAVPDQSQENLTHTKTLRFSRRDHYVSRSRRLLLKLL